MLRSDDMSKNPSMNTPLRESEELNPLEEVEELEELDEVEELDDGDVLEIISEELTPLETEKGNHPGLMKLAGFYSSIETVSLKRSFDNSRIPVIVLDDKLKIIWENSIFKEVFRTEKHRLHRHLNTFLLADLGEQKVNEIIRSLKSKEQNFSWKGSIRSIDESRKAIMASLLIFPLYFENPMEIPGGYGVLFDDLTEYNQKMLHNMFSSLLEASKLKDNDTGSHIERVNRYSALLTRELKTRGTHKEVTPDFLDEIGFLAAMHDVGKIGTPDDILNKTGKLDEREWKIMKEHTINGAYILSTYPSPTAKEIALFHHEKWDGSGYPYGWSGNMIPLAARIVTVADVYDALRMRRSYKEPFEHDKALSIIKEGTGTHFDPELVKIFFEIQNGFRKIFDDLPD